MKKYTLTRFMQEFSTTEKCLAYIASRRWPNGIRCASCRKVTKHHLIASRKCYSCQDCGTQVYPTAGTIFHKSRTPLQIWFYTIFQLSQTRTGIAAKHIERETGVTYKTAWRMCQLIRKCLDEERSPFDGVSEADETYVGARRPRYKGTSKRGRGTSKTPVFGVAQRGGAIVAKVVPNVQRKTIMPILQDAVEEGATVYTDEFNVYACLEEMGYDHDTVKHKDKEYVKYREDGAVVHTNTLEGFWSYPKGAVSFAHRGVSPRYLQRYFDEFTFRTSHRHDTEPMFLTILDRASQERSSDPMPL